MILANIVFAKTGQSFKLKGSIDIDTGKIMLMPVYEEFSPKGAFMEASIVSGKFTFEGNIPNPTLYKVGVRQNNTWLYLSDNFIVDAGSQKIKCNTNALRETPGINNEPTSEKQQKFIPYFSDIEQAYNIIYHQKDSLYRAFNTHIPPAKLLIISNKTDSLDVLTDNRLYEYANTSPDSYIVLWALVSKLNKPYNPIWTTTFKQLSDNVRNSYSGLVYQQKLEAVRLIAVDNKFPAMALTDEKRNTIDISLSYKTSKYTLVDFWFSSCYPCKKQFPIFKEIYAKYYDKGFSIIGVSIDSEKEIPAWRSVINNDKLNWTQLLDVGGSNASKYAISSFPTNFLLNSDGIIIKKNIQPEELQSFLEETLNK